MRQRFVVHGRVQGVNFRAAAADTARRLGVRGRIWNREDGSVECVAEGEPSAVDGLREWLGRGPRLARVERVDASELDGGAEFEDFRIG